MRTKASSRLIQTVCVLCWIAFCWTASAQNTSYPNRVGKIIAPYAPGGAVDSLAREIAQAYTTILGKTFVVENHPGAGGNIGLSVLAKSPNDGYTLGIGAANMLVTNRFLYSSLPFDAAKDFVPVAFIGRVPFVLVVNSSVAADNLKELIALMKSKTVQFNYGSSGMGNTAHLFGELFKLKTGVSMEHIPFKSSGEAVQEVVAGRVQLQFGTPVELLPQISRGAVKAIAVAGSQRLPTLPNVPTLAESGISGFESPTWFGVLAPTGTPASVISILNEATQKALTQPIVKSRLEQNGVQVQSMKSEEFQDFINAEVRKWEPIVRASGAHIN
jgi:tripartite-type tricarboxylate transporter receptor subunit TctC